MSTQLEVLPNKFNTLTDVMNSLNLPAQYFIGFDSLFDELDRLSSGYRVKTGNYPPYNIVKLNDLEYCIELSVSGFLRDELDVELEGLLLKVSGKKLNEDNKQYIHRGLAHRNFTREFTLAETVEIKSVTLENGLLLINLLNKIPEHKLPRKIPIL